MTPTQSSERPSELIPAEPPLAGEQTGHDNILRVTGSTGPGAAGCVARVRGLGGCRPTLGRTRSLSFRLRRMEQRPAEPKQRNSRALAHRALEVLPSCPHTDRLEGEEGIAAATAQEAHSALH